VAFRDWQCATARVTLSDTRSRNGLSNTVELIGNFYSMMADPLRNAPQQANLL
jgi:hypothetical protein